MLVIGVDRGIWHEFAIDPVRNKGLQLRGIISSSTIGPLPKLNKDKNDKANHQRR
jgi:hypothetical protein